MWSGRGIVEELVAEASGLPVALALAAMREPAIDSLPRRNLRRDGRAMSY
jgi:hypothetical protein